MKSEWKDCLEELPKNDECYLVYAKGYGIVVRPFNVYHQCWDDEDADDYFTDAKGGKVSHWMELPTIPVGV